MGKDNIGPGFIYAPYIISNKDPNDKNTEYDDFMKEYSYIHKCCPNCGSESHSTTLIAYVLNMDKKDEYKDLNNCKCFSCGNVHITHDRVNQNYIIKEKIKRIKTFK